MIGLDTNVIVRYIVQDEPRQSAIANRIFEKEISVEQKGFVSAVVLCEVVWVLVRAYKQDRSTISQVLHTLLKTNALEIEHRNCAWRALRDFDTGTADFSDCLLAHIAHAEGASTTLTFDADASRLPFFSLAK